MYLRNLFYLILLTALTLCLISCKEDTVEPVLFGSIEGKVLDSETNLPISSAVVTTSPPTSSIATDGNGTFILKNVPVGTYSITVKKTSYTPTTVGISVSEGVTTSAVIFLSETSEASPGRPVMPEPANQSVDQEIALILSWKIEQSNLAKLLKYDVYLYSDNSPAQERVAENLEDTTYAVDNLKYNTTYFWQVVAKDTGSARVYSEVWSFKTKNFPNYPILFVSDIDDNYEIYMGDESGNTARLTYTSSKELWPQFISASSKLVFTSDQQLDYHIYIKRIDQNDIQKISTLPIASFNNVGIGFDLSPNEKHVIYGHYDKLIRIETDGSNQTELATAPSGMNFREVCYSEQGDKITVLVVSPKPYESEIYLLNSDGTNLQLLIDDVPGSLGSPSFSVDGKRVIYTQDISGNEVSDGRQLNSHIMSVAIDLSDTLDLSVSKPAGTNDLFPRLSPDGSKIVFMNGLNSSNSAEIWTMNITGENRTKICSNGRFPFWKR